MRLFAGLDLPYEMRRNLELLLQLLKRWPEFSGARSTIFISPQSLSAIFPDARLEELKSALAAVPRPAGCGLPFVGWLVSRRRPAARVRSRHPGATGTGRAGAGYRAGLRGARHRARGAGIPPHLTLARIRRPEPLTALKTEISRCPAWDFGVFQVASFHLYRSQLQPGGSIYTKLASFPLAL